MLRCILGLHGEDQEEGICARKWKEIVAAHASTLVSALYYDTQRTKNTE